MIKTLTLKEWFKDKKRMPGWVFLVKNKPIVQIQIFKDRGTWTSSRRKPNGKYTIFWRSRKIDLSRAEKVLKEVASNFFSDKSEPQKVTALYLYEHKGESAGKSLSWFLFADDIGNSLDKYDRRIHLAHKAFIKEMGQIIEFVRYDVNHVVSSGNIFSIHATINQEESSGSDIGLNFELPYFDKDILAKILLETSSLTVNKNTASSLMKSAQKNLQEFFENS